VVVVAAAAAAAEEDGKDPRIFLHRGDLFAAQENSHDAIVAAWRRGGGVGVEIDVRVTRDGVAVLLHDEMLGRTCEPSPRWAWAATARVGDHSWAELAPVRLRRVVLGHGHDYGPTSRGIPRLTHVLETLSREDWSAGASILFDVKDGAAALATMDAVDASPCFAGGGGKARAASCIITGVWPETLAAIRARGLTPGLPSAHMLRSTWSWLPRDDPSLAWRSLFFLMTYTRALAFYGRSDMVTFPTHALEDGRMYLAHEAHAAGLLVGTYGGTLCEMVCTAPYADVLIIDESPFPMS
jgi:glycerophosphoryl diester phosphodiesterase